MVAWWGALRSSHPPEFPGEEGFALPSSLVHLNSGGEGLRPVPQTIPPHLKFIRGFAPPAPLKEHHMNLWFHKTVVGDITFFVSEKPKMNPPVYVTSRLGFSEPGHL